MYRTIDTATWHDPKFRVLPPPGKLLFLYLITNPHAHLSGIYYLPTVTILHESGVKPEAIDTLWNTLSGAGMVYRDKELEVVWVKNMFRFQGRGEKHERSAANQLGTLHNSGIIKDFLKQYPKVKRFYQDRVSNGASRLGTQEQDKDQEQNQENAAHSAGAAELDEKGETITWETVYRAYPKHVEPEPSRQSILAAVRYLRKTKGITTPWTWLLGTVRRYADARRELEEKYPGAKQFVTACHRWVKRKRYLEDPEVWPTELPGFAVSRNGNGAQYHETPKQKADRIVQEDAANG